MTRGSAAFRVRAFAVGVATVIATAAAPGTAGAAGPVALTVDGDGIAYAGFASGGVSRFGHGSGTPLEQWKVPAGNADGLVGPVVALASGPAGGVPNGGDIWVLDANLRVQEFSRSGSFVRGFSLPPCAASETPAPGSRGGLDVTADSIYVAHPCADAVLRFDTASLPARGMGSAGPAASAAVYRPHGLSAPDGAGGPGTNSLFVTEPLRVVRLDLASLADGGTVPVTHTGRPDDVFVAGELGRLFVSETENADPGYSHRIYAFDGDASGGFQERFWVGGPGSDNGRFNSVLSFELATPPDGKASLFVADSGNERVQRINAEPSGFAYWATPAPDPGPYVDDTPPDVAAATIKRRRGDWILRVEAVDLESGLAELGFGRRRGGDFKMRPFERKTKVGSRRRAKFVRVTDVAGNVSRAVKVKRG